MVKHPIEVVEYHRHTLLCQHCGTLQSANWSPEIRTLAKVFCGIIKNLAICD
ncbi:Mobile element protein [Nostoc flagelliforme CCNUN1]|uniref:Mobile element protein n=1 Tax=Nostoc flagelliforme CCNUN1 TaxID=2038116 RepID=A0A2K8SI67_9NOSO|nr:Mobile element protein [Nostoc flagelliforme CCNUN1]